MNFKFLIILFLLGWVYCLNGQDTEDIFKSKSSSANRWARWVLSPKIFPHITPKFLNNQFSINDDKLNITYDRGLEIGMRIEKYYPNRNIDFALSFDYLNRLTGISETQDYFLFNQGISFTPTISFKRGKFEETRHPFVEFGLKNQFIFPNTSIVSYLTDEGNLIQSDDNLLKVYRLSGYLALGMKRDIFNHKGANPRTVGLQNISLNINFPLFNQGNLFKNRKETFRPPFDVFRKNHASSWFIGFSYSDQIDVKKNKKTDAYTLGFIQDTINFQRQFIPPFVDASMPTKNVFGNFYFHTNYQPAVDSISFSSNSLDEQLAFLKPTLSIEIGYTIHLTNTKKFVANDTKKLVKTQENIIPINSFISVGIKDDWFELRGTQDARVNQIELGVSGGLRVNIYKDLLFLMSEYSYYLPISKKIYLPNRSEAFLNISNRSQMAYSLGIAYKRLFIFKVSYRQLETLTDQPISPFSGNHLIYTIGIGI